MNASKRLLSRIVAVPACAVIAVSLVIGPATQAAASESDAGERAPRTPTGRTAACETDPFEVNDEMEYAAPVDQGVYAGLQVCEGDDDWFEVVLQPGHFFTIGATFRNAEGDLDLLGYLEDGTFVASRIGLESYGSGLRTWETDEEFLSALSVSTPLTYLLRVKGATTEVTNPYSLVVLSTAYEDGERCTDLYPTDECEGRPDGKLRLHQFPFPDPEGDYVGYGYFLETLPNYLWARRETIMLVRHAIHEVQLQFPATRPLGIIDISQRDGRTPGWDIGALRHPDGSHNQGGNIDLAYYQTGSDNSARPVCAHDGRFCTSVENHIVDIPRTAYLLAVLARSDRFRVAGVDTLLAPLILEGVEDLVDQGVLENADLSRLQDDLASGPGWPFHHHHIHLSLKWWNGKHLSEPAGIACGWRMEAPPTEDGRAASR